MDEERKNIVNQICLLDRKRNLLLMFYVTLILLPFIAIFIAVIILVAKTKIEVLLRLSITAAIIGVVFILIIGSIISAKLKNIKIVDDEIANLNQNIKIFAINNIEESVIKPTKRNQAKGIFTTLIFYIAITAFIFSFVAINYVKDYQVVLIMTLGIYFFAYGVNLSEDNLFKSAYRPLVGILLLFTPIFISTFLWHDIDKSLYASALVISAIIGIALLMLFLHIKNRPQRVMIAYINSKSNLIGNYTYDSNLFKYFQNFKLDTAKIETHENNKFIVTLNNKEIEGSPFTNLIKAEYFAKVELIRLYEENDNRPLYEINTTDPECEIDKLDNPENDAKKINDLYDKLCSNELLKNKVFIIESTSIEIKFHEFFFVKINCDKGQWDIEYRNSQYDPDINYHEMLSEIDDMLNERIIFTEKGLLHKYKIYNYRKLNKLLKNKRKKHYKVYSATTIYIDR